MPQLIVRNIETIVVDRLREEAARERVSVEEAHRRLLRRTLLNVGAEDNLSFKDFLYEMPDGGAESDADFERPRESPRPVDLD